MSFSLGQNIWRPYTQHATAEPALLVESARGAYLHLKGGRKIFDAVSSWWVTLHGHGQPKIAAAIAAQAARLDQVLFATFTHEPAERLSAALVRIAPAGLERVFFSDNGSTAVEVAIKAAISYWRRKGETRDRIIALEHSYHGDTFAAMSVGARGPFTSDYASLLFKVDRIPCPEAGQEEVALAQLRAYLTENARQTAAMIVEPLILGAGGMRVYSAQVLRSMRELCSSHGVLFIADEVMTGFGRTGTMFACEQAGISPDLMCLSKGITGGFLPLGVTLVKESIFDAFYDRDRSKTFFHGHSYTANPIACAAAVENLLIFDEEPVFTRIDKIKDIHSRELKRFKSHPIVSETRQCGTIGVIELKAGDAGYLSERFNPLASYFMARGVLLRPLGHVLYILPPYCALEEDLVNTYNAIEDSLSIL
jgi:adenosylmethionine-8-amino-7-oxononanoate aminotransferase